jgi:hypothetical protein
MRWGCLVWWILGLSCLARADLQFDVFLGYDGVVREGNWFPVVCEVANDGPPFTAVFELTSGQFGLGQIRRFSLELPTNTRKRFSLPVFSSGRYAMWNARLVDERRKVRAESINLRPRLDLSARSPLLGILPRSMKGRPELPEFKSNRSEVIPALAYMRVELFPDNPLGLEGLDALYLNSERALDLKAGQVTALLTWVRGGGHLIVAVEQPTDVNGTPWLRDLLPCSIEGITSKSMQGELQKWVAGGGLVTGKETSYAPGQLEAVPQLGPGSGLSPPPPGIPPEMQRRYGITPKSGPATAAQRSSSTDPFANLAADPRFDAATLSVATGSLRAGRVLVTSQDAPLIVTGGHERGQVTVLLFSPEREPFLSWKNRPWFWAKLAAIPPEFFLQSDFSNYSRWSIDAVFGALLETRQVRKLPVSWLLLLLVAYLAIIGPVDQIWLKRINRQMLTWLTFPAYVALFSGLIYLIGYKLRAGETEWNEMHLVDVFRRGDRAELRGRTYASVYSPANARYTLASDQRHATLRGEAQTAWSGGRESSRTDIEQQVNGFRAQVFVPVWTSQLLAHDWLAPAKAPFSAQILTQEAGFQVTVANHLDHNLKRAHLVLAGRILDLGELPAGQTKTFSFAHGQGKLLQNFVTEFGRDFPAAVGARQRAFGGNVSALALDTELSALAASFASLIESPSSQRPGLVAGNFTCPNGLDLGPWVEQGQAILLAWDPGQPVIKPIRQFTPRRGQSNTLWRLVIPMNAVVSRQ